MLLYEFLKMAKKIKILQISPQFPFPADDGGRISIANILHEFVKSGADVTFFTYDNGNIPIEQINYVRSFAELVLFKHSIKNTPQRILNSVLKNESIHYAKYFSTDIAAAIKPLIMKDDFNIIHCEHSYMGHLGLYVSSLIKK